MTDIVLVLAGASVGLVIVGAWIWWREHRRTRGDEASKYDG